MGLTDGEEQVSWASPPARHALSLFIHQAIAQGCVKPGRKNGPAMSPTRAPARGLCAFEDSGAASGTVQLLRASSCKFLPGP